MKRYRVSLAGYGGHDPVTLALIAGTQALTEAGVDVTVRLTGTRFDLSAGDYRITAVRVVPVGILPSPIPSTDQHAFLAAASTPASAIAAEQLGVATHRSSN